MFNEMVRELKDVRYIPQLKKNLISIGALKANGLKGTLTYGVLKMLKSSMVVLKSIKWNNMYYLKNSKVIGKWRLQKMSITIPPDCDIWGFDTHESNLCKYWRSKDYWKIRRPASWSFMNTVLLARIQMWSLLPRFIAPKEFFIMYTQTFGDLSRLYHLEVITTLCHLLMIILRYSMWYKNKVLDLFVK